MHSKVVFSEQELMLHKNMQLQELNEKTMGVVKECSYSYSQCTNNRKLLISSIIFK